MIVAGFAYRYEPDWMIDQLRENLAWVDGFAEWDTRNHPSVWVPAKERTMTLYRIARNMGATWFLQAAPDERYEQAAGDILVDATRRYPDRRFSVNLREMWSPTSYRIDGIWGEKKRVRLYRLDRPNGPRLHLDVNLYHLKMITASNREERRRVFNRYNTWDNRKRGFDYLVDETGLQTQEVPEDRMYTPPYKLYQFRVPD